MALPFQFLAPAAKKAKHLEGKDHNWAILKIKSHYTAISPRAANQNQHVF